MRTLLNIADGADRFVRVVGEVMAWSGLVMVLLIGFNVFARYLFSYGSVALQEMEWHLMAVGALFGMSYGLNRGEEVRVDVLYAYFPERAKLAVNAVGALLLCLVAVAVAWLAIGFVKQSYMLHESSADPGGLPDRWILKAMIPAAFALLALQAFTRLIGDIAGLLGARVNDSIPGKH